jgi:hypothetical protein
VTFVGTASFDGNDHAIGGARVLAPLLFSDGFESGGTGGWSLTVP